AWLRTVPERFAVETGADSRLTGLPCAAGVMYFPGLMSVSGGSMDFQDIRQARPGDAGRSATLDAAEWSMATASELMFFGGAPLAHVVAYREHLRMAGI